MAARSETTNKFLPLLFNDNASERECLRLQRKSTRGETSMAQQCHPLFQWWLRNLHASASGGRKGHCPCPLTASSVMVFFLYLMHLVNNSIQLNILQCTHGAACFATVPTATYSAASRHSTQRGVTTACTSITIYATLSGCSRLHEWKSYRLCTFLLHAPEKLW